MIIKNRNEVSFGGVVNHSHGGLTVHLLFTERPVFFHHLFFRITEQRERNIVLPDEFLMRGFLVR